ncbi:hypothetical protein P7K49_026283, partial [Saguinus oedipus]
HALFTDALNEWQYEIDLTIPQVWERHRTLVHRLTQLAPAASSAGAAAGPSVELT